MDQIEKKNKKRTVKKGPLKGKHKGTRTPEWFVEQPYVPYLFFNSREKFHPRIWDPCCGRGTTPEEAIKAGYLTYATDLYDRGYMRFDGVRNFLTCNDPHPEADIVCNPPYYKGLSIYDFLIKAREVCYQKVAFILRQDFLYGGGRWSEKQERWINVHDQNYPTSYEIFRKIWPPKIIYHISDRPSMPPGEQVHDKFPSGGSQDFCIIVWDKGFDGHIPGFEGLLTLTDWLKLPDGMGKDYGLDPITHQLTSIK